ncbi:hypothetical protein BCR34DRAFT_482203 [Clohesyomyces aquaticus]|uniref:HNH domain-containing protein n=1 Tax=Clohesyomyces aquaticus TaxID=1231657 RepID=A0A1Y1ZR49_9PLEO|nr:hypothetical protein BCR34DRAFT_482203 [Clohesyomyces aquaticus]
MADIIPEDEQSNYETFRDCLSEPVLRILAAPVERPKKKRREHRKKSVKGTNSLKEELEDGKGGDGDVKPSNATTDAEDMSDFIDYLSTQLFTSLPPSLRTLTHPIYKSSPPLQIYTPPLPSTTLSTLLSHLPPSALDNLSSYALLPAADDPSLRNLLLPVYESYISVCIAPPPIWSSTRTEACELCLREWVPTTYHHLIPRSTHARVLKRGWHTEDRLGSVAWLCRACHSFVHRVAGNEELARSYYTVELLEEREDVRAWVKWVGRVRWRKR